MKYYQNRDVSITCFVWYQSTVTSISVLILKEKLEGLKDKIKLTPIIFFSICRQCYAIIQLCLVDISKIYYYCRTCRYSIFHSYQFSFIFDLYIPPNIKAVTIDSYMLYKHWSRTPVIRIDCSVASADLMKYKTLNEILMSLE